MNSQILFKGRKSLYIVINLLLGGLSKMVLKYLLSINFDYMNLWEFTMTTVTSMCCLKLLLLLFWCIEESIFKNSQETPFMYS